MVPVVMELGESASPLVVPALVLGCNWPLRSGHRPFMFYLRKWNPVLCVCQMLVHSRTKKTKAPDLMELTFLLKETGSKYNFKK